MAGLRRVARASQSATADVHQEAGRERESDGSVVGPVREFNTGRQYGPGGQRIAYAVVRIDGEERVAFRDCDRDIHGTLPSPGELGTVRDGYVLNRYDAGDYEVGGPHAAALLEHLAGGEEPSVGGRMGLRMLHARGDSGGILRELLSRPGFKGTAIGQVVVKAEETLPGWLVPEVALALAESKKIAEMPKRSGTRWTSSRPEFWAGRPEIGDAARFANGVARTCRCFDPALLEDVFMAAYRVESRRALKGLCDKFGFQLYPKAVNASDPLVQPVEQDPDVDLDWLRFGGSLLGTKDELDRVFGRFSEKISERLDGVRKNLVRYGRDLIDAGNLEDGRKVRTRSSTGYYPYRLEWKLVGLSQFSLAADLRGVAPSVIRGHMTKTDFADAFEGSILKLNGLGGQVEIGLTLYKEKMEKYAEELPQHGEFFKAQADALAVLIKDMKEDLGRLIAELPMLFELARHVGAPPDQDGDIGPAAADLRG